MITIRQYSIEEFRDYLERQSDADIQATVLHHTWKPNADSYQGLQTVRNIQKYHRNERGWSDIGANAYAAPDGSVYPARPLNWNNYAHAYMRLSPKYWPAKLRELAGDDRNWLNKNAFGLETVGNFDKEDPQQSEAMSTALDVLAAVHEIWELSLERNFFHRDIAYKGCPGSRVTHEWVRQELKKRQQGDQLVKLIEYETGEVVGQMKMVPNGDHIADQRKLYIRAPEGVE